MTVFFFFSLGVFLYAVFGVSRKHDARTDNALFTSFSLFFFVVVLAGLALTRLGLHTLLNVSVCLLVISAGIVMFERRYGSAEGKAVTERLDGWQIALVLLPFVIAAFHAFFPTYYMLGGRDPGLYFIYSVVIGQTGALDLPSAATLVSGTPVENLIRTNYPGLYDPVRRGFDSDPSLYFAQFHHAFSAFGAVMYQLGGIEGVVRANAVLSLFALWSFGATLKRLVSEKFAVLGVLLLGLNVAFAWNARITLTETLSLAGTFAGIAFLFDALKNGSRWHALLSGLFLSLSVFTRIDGVLISGLLFGIVALYDTNDKKILAAFGVLTATYFVLSTVALFDGWQNSLGYYYDLWKQGSSKYLVLGHFACLVAAAFIIWLRFHEKWITSIPGFDTFWRHSLKGACAGFVGIFLFMYFVLPEWNPNDFGHRAFREMEWYVSVVLFIAGPLAILAAAKKPDNRFTAILVLFFLVSVVLFSIEPAISADHIWASRRWVPLVIPGLILAFVVFLSTFPVRLRAALGLVGLGVYAATLFPYARTFYFESVLASYHKDYDAAAESLRSIVHDQNAIFLTRNAQIASVLRYVYDLPVVLARASGLRKVLDGEYKVDEQTYLLSGSDLLGRLPSVGYSNICGNYLQKYRGKRPDRLYERCNSFYVYKLGVEARRVPVTRLPAQPGPFHTISGAWTGKGVQTTEEAGWLLYGPYSLLLAGSYEVDWHGSFECSSLGDGLSFQVAAGKGKVIVADSREAQASTICSKDSDGTVVRLSFTTETSLSDVEYRVWASVAQTEIETVVIRELESEGAE